MKKLTTFIAVTAIAVLFNNAFANRESGGRSSARAVFVEFTSFGTGIDDSQIKGDLPENILDSYCERAIQHPQVRVSNNGYTVLKKIFDLF